MIISRKNFQYRIWDFTDFVPISFNREGSPQLLQIISSLLLIILIRRSGPRVALGASITDVLK
jgi:hypothetical protein